MKGGYPYRVIEMEGTCCIFEPRKNYMALSTPKGYPVTLSTT